MSSGLLIIGAGGHGRVIADIAQQSGEWSQLAFLDEAVDLPDRIMDIPVLKTMGDSASLRTRYPDAVVAVGECSRRMQLIDEFSALGFRLPVIRHPAAIVSRYAEIGAGSQVLALSVINAGARTGTGCIINTAATVDHDCDLGDGVHISPGAHLAGGVRIARCTWIGIGASVRGRCQIGREVTVGAGAAVVSDIDDGQTVVGVPARQINRPHG